MRMTRFEAHDSSAAPEREEQIIDAVIEDINESGSASIEAVQGFIKDDEILEAFKMLLTNSLCSAGTLFEKNADERLGKYIKARILASVREEME